MNNIKTTLSGLLASLGLLAPMFNIPGEVGQAASVVGLFLLGLFSRDRSSNDN